METNPEIARLMLGQFLEAWKPERLQHMTLKEYVSVNDPLTFTQWVEHRTKPLGSINGKDSSKFGMWKRKDANRKLDKYTNIGIYSWERKLPFTTAEDAFAAIKAELLSIIDAARRGDFAAIDRRGYLLDIFKWKVAYLYSGERLVSIFSLRVLRRIAARYGLSKKRRSVSVSMIQQAMMDRKPFYMSIYEYSNYVFQTFGGLPEGDEEEDNKDDDDAGTSDGAARGGRRRKRKAAAKKNVGSVFRRGSADTFVNQEHNRLQELLREQLQRQYGASAVLMEHNYVDLKVITPQKKILYEVKSAGFASACVEQALGQILRYAFDHANNSEDAVELIIAGKYPPNESDAAYIRFVKAQFTIPLNYIAIER